MLQIMEEILQLPGCRSHADLGIVFSGNAVHQKRVIIKTDFQNVAEDEFCLFDCIAICYKFQHRLTARFKPDIKLIESRFAKRPRFITGLVPQSPYRAVAKTNHLQQEHPFDCLCTAHIPSDFRKFYIE